MPQLVKKRRSGWAVLATGALVASLLAVGASPAAALDEDSRPDSPAATSACVGDATGDMMFSDVSEMHAFRGAINCLAYYGVTVGYGDGTFRPNADVSNEEMVLFMERAAGVAGADDEAVVGDFAMTGSDPVNRGDMALLIARLLVAATNDESPVNVKNADDGTFAVEGVDEPDYFADSRRSQNRVKDSAASALYELGVAKGTGMGYFSPASTVSRGAMAAFITRALAHTTARPEGVTIQSHAPGEVTVSVRDANFHPVANAYIDRFLIATAKLDDAFKDDGSCGRVVTVDSNATTCTIDALDPVTGLSGDYPFSAGTPDEGGTTVWAWTGETGDKIEDGGEGLASINLTERAPNPATAVMVSTDLAKSATRAVFGSTVTVTIQLVDSEGNPAGPPDGGASYRVIVTRDTDEDQDTDADVTAPVAAGDSDGLTNVVHKVDASGKATFNFTAPDPDPTNSNNPNADASATPPVPGRIDRVRVSYSVEMVSGPAAPATPTDGSQTVVFSDAVPVVSSGSIETVTSYLVAPMSGGSAGNVATVVVLDQYARPMRGQLVRLSSDTDNAAASTFPVARRTDSSGTVRIGYSFTGIGSRQTLIANIWSDAGTPADTSDDTLTPIGGTGVGQVNTVFNWVQNAPDTDDTNTITDQTVRIADIDKKLIVVGGTATTAPLLVPYDANDQFAVGPDTEEALTGISVFEKALADDKGNDTVTVTSFDADERDDVARFELTVVPNP